MHSDPREQEFIATVYRIYHQKNRDETMPWRIDHSPYRVFLSEMMLQQTQVKRVIEYFNVFFSLWPQIEQLARTSFSDVLFQWQGLGYNRRAKHLHTSAKIIVDTYHGQIPNTRDELLVLPGVGDYTASAILAFAYNQPSVVLETNIRRAIIHWFFKDEQNVAEAEVYKKVEALVDKKQPRVWYWALMDYGVYLSKHVENPNRRSKQYTKQNKFMGSNRQIRGTIMRVMLTGSENKKMHTSELIGKVEKEFKALNARADSTSLTSEIEHASSTQNQPRRPMKDRARTAGEQTTSKACVSTHTAGTVQERIRYNIHALLSENMIASEADQLYIPD